MDRMRVNYRELPRVFAFMTSMPPPALRIYIIETSDPDWVGSGGARVQQVYTNLSIANHHHFGIYPERRYHPELSCANVQLYSHNRNPSIVNDMIWWFTGFYLQNDMHNNNIHDIPLVDFDSRLLQDLLFDHGRPISLNNLHRVGDLYRTVLDRRFHILSEIPEDSHYPDENRFIRRRLSFSLRDLERNSTPPPRRRFDDTYNNDLIRHEIPRTPRETMSIARRAPRNIIIQPPANSPTNEHEFTLPRFVLGALIESNIKNDKSCSITMIPFKDISQVSITSCYHCFEKEALGRWLSTNQTCPECRSTISGTLHYAREN